MTGVRTAVVGVGNPTLGDDGVGLAVAAAVAARLDTAGVDCGDVSVAQLGEGGLRLAEALVGSERAVLIDALVTGTQPPGTVVELTLDQLLGARHVDCVHDLSLPLALDLARASGVPVPDGERIRIFGIEAADVDTFRDTLTPPVAAAVPAVVAAVLEAVVGWVPAAAGDGRGRRAS